MTDHGYITVEQAKEEGKFSHNVYILNTQVTDKKAPCLHFGYTGNGDTQNEDTNTNSSKINNLEEEEEEEEQVEKFPKKYIGMALKAGATKLDLAIALEKMDLEPDIKSPVAWLQKALENEIINRELASRPKTKRNPKPSTKSHSTLIAKQPKTDPSKYDNFYL